MLDEGIITQPFGLVLSHGDGDEKIRQAPFLRILSCVELENEGLSMANPK